MRSIFDDLPVLKDVVKNCVKDDFSILDFQGIVHAAVLEAIEEGYMFFDYLQHRPEYEDGCFKKYDDEKWEEIIIKAMGHDRYDYLIHLDFCHNEGVLKKLGFDVDRLKSAPDPLKALKLELGYYENDENDDELCDSHRKFIEKVKKDLNIN